MILVLPKAEFHCWPLRETVGVCAPIVPRNIPLFMTAWEIAPTIATGHTVVLKPAEQTPVTALLLGKLFEEVGVPAGVAKHRLRRLRHPPARKSVPCRDSP